MNRAYVAKIAEFVLKTNKGKEFEKYIKEFDPSKPKFKQDEIAYFKYIEEDFKKENEIKDARQKFRNEDYYIRHFSYAFFGGKESIPMPKAPDFGYILMEQFIKKMGSWIHKLFTNEPVFLDSSVPYYETYNNFIKNHNVNINVKEMSSAMDELAKDKPNLKDTFKAYYKCMFSSIASRVFKNERVTKLHKDYEDVMRCLLKTKVREERIDEATANSLLNGGMDKKELADFLKETEKLIQSSYREFELNVKKMGNNPHKQPIVLDINEDVTVGEKPVLDEGLAPAPLVHPKTIEDLTVDEYINEIDELEPLNLDDLEEFNDLKK